MNSDGTWAKSKQLRVLVADDDPIVRSLIRVKLSVIAHEVVEAADGREAWELLYNQPFQLALVDLGMPNLDGLSLIQCIRTHPRTRHMPIVVVTVRDDQDSLRKALEAGASSYMTKPLTWSMFNAHVQHLLRLSATAEAAERALQRRRDLAAASRNLATYLIAGLATQSAMIPAPSDLATWMTAAIDAIAQAESDAPLFCQLGQAALEAGAVAEKACPGRSVAIDATCEGIAVDCSAAMLTYLLSEVLRVALEASDDQSVQLFASVSDGRLTVEARGIRAPWDMPRELLHQLTAVRLIMEAHGGNLECDASCRSLSMCWPADRFVTEHKPAEAYRAADRLAV